MNELAWVTQAQVASLGLIKSATVTLTDDQIKGLPTTPVVILPATEILNFEGSPTQIPNIISAAAFVDARAGAYTNVNGTGAIALSIGSDDDITTGVSVFIDPTPAFSPQPISTNASRSVYSFLINRNKLEDGDLIDNAVVILMENSGDGDLTGGDPANTMDVIVYYTLVDLSLI